MTLVEARLLGGAATSYSTGGGSVEPQLTFKNKRSEGEGQRAH